MIDQITKHQTTTGNTYKFCLLIPSWNNMAFLKNCLNSIKKNSYYNDIQIIVIINEGTDGTLEWIETQQEIDYIHSKTNIGICYALNIARSLIKSDYVVYVNDDMYLLPDWDLAIETEIQRTGHNRFMFSCTMIEPKDSGNKCVIVKDYGTDTANFKEDQLLNDYKNLFINDWNGSTWPPTIIHLDLWDLVGGMSIEYSPGMYSDPDLSRKLYEAGVRIFKGIGTSLVYHFGQKTTRKIKSNNGRKLFLHKWGITPRTFTASFLQIGTVSTGEVASPKITALQKIITKCKQRIN
ncbi:MAG: glycosyltransferase [Bacteroidales bacterium]|jgi:glycosyltransferase involved in cell wall biosynthesis|nr:glycosyltransferase [Bacteroidales bacterium]